MAARVVDDDGVGDSVFSELEGCQARPLVARPRFVHPDMDGEACVVGFVDGGEGCSPVDRREPAGVAMGEDLNGRTGLRRGDLFQDRKSVVPDRRTARDIFVADRAGFDACSLSTLVRRTIRQRFDHALNAIDGPLEIDRGRACCQEFPRRTRQGFIARVLFEGQSQTVCRHCTDQWSPPDPHGPNRFGGGGYINDRPSLESVRQEGLVDDAKFTRRFIEPDRSVVFACDLHEPSVALELAEPMKPATQLLESPNPTEIRKSNHKGAFDDLGTDLVQQFHCRLGRPPRCNQIVDEEHALAGLDRPDMQLDTIAPVLEIEVPPDRRSREFAGFANRHESKTHLVGDRRAEDEAAGFDSHDQVDAVVPVAVGDSIDGEPEAFGVEQERRDVTELDSRLGVVGDGADVGLDVQGFCAPS